MKIIPFSLKFKEEIIMKKIVLSILIVFTFILLTGCGKTIVYKNLTYQGEHYIIRNSEIFVFTNESGNKIALGDSPAPSKYENIFVKDKKYNIEVTVEDSTQFGNYIESITEK
jgi:hypothetical protein